MKTQPLSPATRDRLNALFAPADRAAAERMLVDRCGNNLPFLEHLDSVGLERYRFPALKFGNGSLVRLQSAVELARTDWRELLMSAGFGEDVTEHPRWSPRRSS